MSEPQGGSDHRREILKSDYGRSGLTLAVLLTVALPAGDLLHVSPSHARERHLFDYLASDAYYYFVVARNIALHGRVSFDGTLPTNGFHPVWQLVSAIGFLIGRVLRLQDLVVVNGLLIAQLVALGCAVWLLGRGLAAAQGRLTPLFATLPLGAYALVMSPVWIRARHTYAPGAFGTLWSYANGMESACVILAFALVSWRFLARREDSRRGAVLDGILLAVLIMSRLDTVFVSLALWSVRAGEARGDRARMRNVLTTGATLLGIIVVYLVVNRVYSGRMLPVSGSIKSSFPYVNLDNLRRLVGALISPRAQTYYRLYRIGQHVLPAAAAIVQLFVCDRALRRASLDESRVDTWLAATGIGVTLTSIYDLLYVELWDHGSWYCPIGTTFFSLWAIVTLARVVKGFDRNIVLVLLGATALSIVYFVFLSRGVDSNRDWADFYFIGAPRVRAFYRSRNIAEGQPRFIEVDDGIWSFATGFPSMSGKGFALDAEGARAMRHHELIDLGVQRGYNRVVSVMYMDARGFNLATPSDRACELISGITPADLCSHYRFTIEYTHDLLAVVRVDPR